MNPSRLAIFLLALITLLSPDTIRAADGNITLTVTVIAMPKDKALAFITNSDLNNKPADALKELVAMVEKKEARSVANPSVTLKSGQRSIAEAESITLDAEAVASPAGDKLDVTVSFVYFKNKIITSLTVDNGGVKYLGSFDNAGDKNETCLAFIKADMAK
jgi:hypothetical protein